MDSEASYFPAELRCIFYFDAQKDNEFFKVLIKHFYNHRKSHLDVLLDYKWFAL